MNDNFKPKTVSEFLDGCHHFVIPSFQRGYRWDTKQVNDLLEDLYSFVTKKDQESYFLQPIVVRDISGLQNPKKEGAKYPPGTWEVLDGQQRLTTMLLILKNLFPYLSAKKVETFKDRLYDISYVVRDNMDFDAPDPESDIDSYYLHNANEYVRAWMSNRSDTNGGIFEKIPGTLFNGDGDQKVQFIWYVTQQERASDIEAIEVFNRLNKGKIGLTATELIKALFILSCDDGDGQTKAYEAEQQKFALVWDLMERRFQDDDFWFFINAHETDVQTRMDILFDFVAQKSAGDDADFSYRYFQKKFDESNERRCTFSELWKQVSTVFDCLVHWYEDVQLYNYIGYLVAVGKTPLDIHNTMKTAKGSNEEWDDENTYKVLEGLIARTFKKSSLDAVTYEDGETVRKLLLLFNVELYRAAGLRFPFASYKKESWDIEHVDSQTTNTMQELSDKLEWIRNVEQILETDPSNEAKDLKALGVALGERLRADQRETDNNFGDYYKKIVAYYSRGTGYDIDGADKDSLGNLVLLDSGTNRSYQNAPFPYKRRCVVQRDMRGEFVPIGTKNVFLKYYSTGQGGRTALDSIRWHETDKESYLLELHRKLDRFVGGNK